MPDVPPLGHRHGGPPPPAARRAAARGIRRRARAPGADGAHGCRDGRAGPRPLALCEDPDVLGAPFYLMERVHGHSVRTALPPPWRAARTAGAWARPRRRAGRPARHRRRRGRPGGPRAPGGVPRASAPAHGRAAGGVQGRALPELDAVGAWLADHVPDSPAPALLHGDLKLDNVILAPASPARVAAVIDWELSTLGDPLADLEVAALLLARGGRGARLRSPSPT